MARGDLKRFRQMSQRELEDEALWDGSWQRRMKGCPGCSPDAKSGIYSRGSALDHPQIIFWKCSNCNHIQVMTSSKGNLQRTEPNRMQQRSIDRIRSFAEKNGEVTTEIKPDGYSGGFWVTVDVDRGHVFMDEHAFIHVARRGAITVHSAGSIGYSNAGHWAYMLRGKVSEGGREDDRKCKAKMKKENQ